MNEANQQLTIGGETFPSHLLYNAGDQLTEHQAYALNQYRLATVATNWRRQVTKAKEQGPEALEALRADIERDIREYDFGPRERTRRTVGPDKHEAAIDREAKSLVRQRLKELLRTQGQRLSDYPKDQLNELIDEYSQRPNFREAAEQAVARKAEERERNQALRDSIGAFGAGQEQSAAA